MRHLKPGLGRIRLVDVSPADINRLYRDLVTARGNSTTTRLSSATVRRVHATLHRALRDAVRWEYLDKNPADGADPPKTASGHEMRTWDAEELRKFLQFASNHELFPLWTLLATTGMRRGEALGLRWGDVDLDAGVVAVRRAVVAVGGKVVVSQPKTVRGRRVVALDPKTVEILKAYKEERRAQSRQALIFARADGSPLRPWQVSKAFVRLTHQASLPRIRVHDLRHTHATLALRAGIHPKIVSERLGHATVSLTLDVYSHAIPHLQREAADAIGRLVFGTPTRRGCG